MKTTIAEKMSLFLIVFLIVIHTESMAYAGQGPSPYQAKTMYKGPYRSDLLFHKNADAKVWMPVSKKNYQKFVTCQDALSNLRQEGQWMGHLKADGSCGSPSEPSEFAIGNRLNYRSLSDENSSGK